MSGSSSTTRMPPHGWLFSIFPRGDCIARAGPSCQTPRMATASSPMRVARSEALAGVSGRSCVRPGGVRALLLLGRGLLAVCLATVGVRSAPVRAAERRDPLDTAALLATSYRVDPDLVYLSTPGWEGKVDLY